MKFKQFVRRAVWTVVIVAAFCLMALTHLGLTEVLATVAWCLMVAASVGFTTLLVGWAIGHRTVVQRERLWWMTNVFLGACAGALVSHLLTRDYHPHWPEPFRLYLLVLAWGVLIPLVRCALSSYEREHGIGYRVAYRALRVRDDNNARWMFIAFLAVNCTILAVLYGLPGSVPSASEIGVRAATGANEVWTACRDKLWFFLFGNDPNTFPPTLFTVSAEPIVPSPPKTWAFICIALLLWVTTIIYFPKAFADDALRKLRDLNEWLHTRRQTEGETTETPALRAPSRSGLNWRHILTSIAGFVGVDVVIETLIKVFEKKATA